MNFTSERLKLGANVKDPSNWEPGSVTPNHLNGLPLEPGGTTQLHVEIANGQTSAKFDIAFVFPAGDNVYAEADAWPVVNNGKRQGYLWSQTGSGTPNHYRILEAQYDAQPHDPNHGFNWRHLAIVILPKRDPRRWMADLPDDTKLNTLTIPGSHDTGTSAIAGRVTDLIVRSRICQNLSITQQLNVGVRFLDIRLDKDYGYEICHQDTMTALWMYKDCLVPVVDFLNENPTEAVVMSIQSDHGTTNAFHDDFLNMVAAAPFHTRILFDFVPLPLKDCRAKIVVLRRYWIDPKTNRHTPEESGAGFAFHEFKDQAGNSVGWPDNSDTFKIYGDGEVIRQQIGNQPVAIQDMYNLGTWMMASKVELIRKYLDAAKNTLPAAYFLNFTSCMATGHAWDDPRSFAVGENGINAALMTYMVINGAGRYGILPMDFVATPPEEALVDLLISTNFGR